ncbi:MAG: GGDEF domain-containing protein [Sphingopyxis sp.]|nr:GGDEF domain-containing protein [Sphingopyxis sp.]
MPLFWFDLDRFKEVNDTLGHPVGDRVLVEVANRLRAVCDPEMLISRFGGDEFVVAAPQMSRVAADSFGRLILTVLSQPFQVDGHSIAISASLGIALYPEDGQTASVIMQQADMALYASKMGGAASRISSIRRWTRNFTVAASSRPSYVARSVAASSRCITNRSSI